MTGAAISTASRGVLDGKFMLASQLGEGRLGRIFKARVLTSDRVVAVRLLKASLLDDREKTGRLLANVVAARSLGHRNICPILGFHMAGTHPYLVQEYIAGPTLDELLRQKPGSRLGQKESLRIAQAMLETLQYAHQNGLRHGNLHPGNIKIRPDGTTCLLDLGVRVDSEGEPQSRCAPPEGGVPTTEGDVYSVGMVFYRMLSGFWPATDAGGADPKPIIGLTATVNHAIMACLEAEPAARPTVDQLLHALRAEAPRSADVAIREENAPEPRPSLHEREQEKAQEAEDLVVPAEAAEFKAPGNLFHIMSVAAGLALILSLAVATKDAANSDSPAVRSASIAGTVPAKRAVPASDVEVASSRTPSLESALPVDLDKAPTVPNLGDAWTSPELGAEFRYVPSGIATIGSPDNEPHRDSDERIFQARLTKGFWMARFEVTQGEWERVMGTRPWEGRAESNPNLPATWISWEQANQFIYRLNRVSQGARYRLPTEAEWEFAARAGSKSAHAHGSSADGLADQAWFRDNSNAQAQPVGLKNPNAYGLYDVQGNVWELVQDWYAPYPEGVQQDPFGPAGGDSRVVRGGSWFNPAEICRLANRHKVNPNAGDRHIGFRLVRD